MQIKKDVVCVETRLRVVPPFFLRDSRASETLARVKITPHEKRRHTCRHFLAWGDFHARSRFARSTIPEEKSSLLVVYVETSNSNCSVHPELNFPSAGSLESCDLTEPFFFKYSGDELSSARVY